MRAWLLICCILLALSGVAGAQDQAVWQPGHHESSALLQLSAAREFLHNLETEESPLERRILIAAAIDSLTALYQLHGCEWARKRLAQLYAKEDRPPFILGYSMDGRLRVQAELLDLQNPAFEGLSVLLVTLESRTALELSGEPSQPMQIEVDGRWQTVEPLTPGHPAWDQLRRLAATFNPPSYLPPGSGVGFKQLFGLDADDTARFSAVSFAWGEYQIELRDFSMPEQNNE